MRRPRARQLSKEQWTDAALTLLATGGSDAVQVEPLARRLRVTKGSFYWHFRDRPALLAAVLRRWEEENTAAIITEVEAGGGDAVVRLRRLFERAPNRRLLRLEVSLRQWAGRDRRVRSAVARVDRRRLAYVRDLFVETGLTPPDAEARAFLAYSALFGQIFIVGPDSSRAPRSVFARCGAHLLSGCAPPTRSGARARVARRGGSDRRPPPRRVPPAPPAGRSRSG